MRVAGFRILVLGRGTETLALDDAPQLGPMAVICALRLNEQPRGARKSSYCNLQYGLTPHAYW
jgi:hypothetical protein